MSGDEPGTVLAICFEGLFSPRERGKRDLAEESGMREGLIPAHAGKT